MTTEYHQTLTSGRNPAVPAVGDGLYTATTALCAVASYLNVRPSRMAWSASRVGSVE
jgi:hypothetical protein